MIFTICKKLRFIILKANWSLITEKSPLMNSKTADTNPVRFSSSALSFKGLLICNCVNHPLSMQHVSLLKNWFLNKRNVPTHDMPKGTVSKGTCTCQPPKKRRSEVATALCAKVNGDRNVVLKCYEVQQLTYTYGLCYDNYL